MFNRYKTQFSKKFIFQIIQICGKLHWRNRVINTVPGAAIGLSFPIKVNSVLINHLHPTINRFDRLLSTKFIFQKIKMCQKSILKTSLTLLTEWRWTHFFLLLPPPQVILIEIRSFYLLSGNNKQQWKRMPVFNKVTLEEIFIF